MEKQKIVGVGIPSVDAVKKVTGTAYYSTDLKFKNMLFGGILRSPLPHALILNIDTKKAAKIRGVKAVITAEDTPKIKYGIGIEDQYPLALGKVRYIGDEVAAVAAIDIEAVEEALSLIEVDYKELEPVFNPEESIRPEAPLIHDQERNIAATCNINRGNPESAFEEADYIFEERYETSNPNHCNLEPIATVAYFDFTGKLNIWCATQVPFRMRTYLSKILGISESKVRVVQTYVGGGFGAKAGAPQPIYPIAALLSLKTLRPVKMENTRREEFLTNRHRLSAIINLKMGVKKDGIFLAKETRILADCGAYAGPGNNPLILNIMSMSADSLYRIPNIKTEARLVYTNKVPSGSFRGFGNPAMHFALESMMDTIAAGLNVDPVDLRLKNATRSGDTTVHGWMINSCGLTDCLEKSAQFIRWNDRKKNKRNNVGLGISCGIHHSSRRPEVDNDSSTTYIKTHEDGRISVICGEGDIGQGANTIFSQIAAEILGIDIKDVDIVPVDTDISPICRGAFGTRVTITGGNSVRLAALDAKEKLLEIASKLLRVDVPDLEVNSGRIYVKGFPQIGFTIGELAKKNLYRKYGAPIIGIGSYDPNTSFADPDTLYGNISPGYIFCAHAAEVEVDVQTGQVKVLKIIAAHDLGKAINPMGAEGQIEGGVIQGLGYALLEELVIQKGKVMNPNLTDYKVYTAPDIPEIKDILVETIEPAGPFGAKGLGEAVLLPTAPAIANAIYDAIGVRIKELPITPEKILQALKANTKNKQL